MKRSDRIKLNFTRNWALPGKERLATLLKLSKDATGRLKNGIIWLRDENIALYASADNYIERVILQNGSYESEIGKLIAVFVKKGDIVLDIGANLGLQSLRMAAAAGAEGKVYAFEPLQYLQKKLKQNLLLNRADNVIIMPVALSDTEAEQDYRIQPDAWNQGTFSLREKSEVGDIEKISIKIGDNLPEIKSLPALNFIKIDVEGFELAAMLGLKQTISKHRPKIIFEYDENYWNQSGHKAVDCYNFFMELNYGLYQIADANAEIISSAALIQNGNVLCIPID